MAYPMTGGYGAPQQQQWGGQPGGYGAPPQGGGYGAPPQGGGYGAPPQGGGYGAPPQQQWGGAPPQQQQWGAPQGGGYGAPQGGFGAPQGGFGAPQGGYGAPQGGYGAPPAGYGAPQGGYGAPAGGFGAPTPGGYDAGANWGAGGGAPGGPPQCLRAPTSRTDPVQQEVQSPPNTPHIELQRVIAAEYNKSPDAQRAGDRISSGNVEIQNVTPSGNGSMVTFCVNDGEYTPDAGERGMLTWIILGGIAGGVASKILGRKGGGGGWGKSFF